MIAKDLVVLGDVRILGELYTSSATSAGAAVASYSTSMVAAGSGDSDPESEGEVVWEYE